MFVAGSCLCGAVRFEVRLPFRDFVNCHCSRCRKATGSAYAANALVDREALRWLAGTDKIRRYDLPSARSFATAVCSDCGSPVPHATRSGSAVIVPAGSLDDDPGVAPSRHVHWSSRAAWVTSACGLPTAE